MAGKANPGGWAAALSNVDNTADVDKPVSTAQQEAINSAKAECVLLEQADQPLGWPKLDAKGDLVGPTQVRYLPESVMNETVLGEGEIALTSDTLDIRRGDGVRRGGYSDTGFISVELSYQETLNHEQNRYVFLTMEKSGCFSPTEPIADGYKSGQKLTIIRNDISVFSVYELASAGKTTVSGGLIMFETAGDSVEFLWADNRWTQVSPVSNINLVALGRYSKALTSSARAEKAATLASGYRSKADVNGMWAHSGFSFSAAADYGNAQFSIVPIGRDAVHSSTSWIDLRPEPGSSNSWVTVPSDGIYGFTCRIIGLREGGTGGWDYEIKGAIKNDGGTTTLLHSTVTTLYEDASNTTLEVQAVADDTNDALLVQVRDTGSSGYRIRWIGQVNITRLVWVTGQ